MYDVNDYLMSVCLFGISSLLRHSSFFFLSPLFLRLFIYSPFFFLLPTRFNEYLPSCSDGDPSSHAGKFFFFLMAGKKKESDESKRYKHLLQLFTHIENDNNKNNNKQ